MIFRQFPTPFLPKFLQFPYYKALTSQLILLVIKLLSADYLVFHTDFISIGDTMLCNTLGGGGGGGITPLYWNTGCAIY